MSKRFTDTELNTKKWFRKLSPTKKSLWDYLCRSCDAAGVLDFDEEIASFLIGDTVKESDLEEFGNRVEKLENGKYWLTGFIEFQYGELSKKCKPHAKVFSLLKKHEIYERVCGKVPKGTAKGIHTLEEEEEEEEEYKVKVKEEEEEESENKSRLTPGAVADAWNQIIGIDINKPYSALTFGNGEAFQNFQHAIKKEPFDKIEGWETLFKQCTKSKFLTCACDTFSLMWVLTGDNMYKINAGNYSNRMEEL